MSTLLLVRHGQASFGEDHYDALSVSGERQAEATGQWLGARNATFTSVVSGPRKRQSQSAEIILSAARLNGISLQIDSGLDEFGEGEEILTVAEAQSGLSLIGNPHIAKEEILKYYSEAYLAWFQGEAALPGRLSFSEFRQQVAGWLAELSGPRYESGQKTLAVTSAGVIGAVMCEVLNLPDKQWPSLIGVIDNASITEILYTRTRLGLRCFNSSAHLDETLLTGI